MAGWACETWPDRGRRILGLPGDPAVTRVRREHLDLDLVVDVADAATVVVENKAFALPDEAQLRDYAKVVATRLDGWKPDATLVLLSLADPGWAEVATEHGTWRHVSYRELGRWRQEAFGSGGDFAEQVAAHHARPARWRRCGSFGPGSACRWVTSPGRSSGSRRTSATARRCSRCISGPGPPGSRRRVGWQFQNCTRCASPV